MSRKGIDPLVVDALKRTWFELKDKLPKDQFPMAKEVLTHVEKCRAQYGLSDLPLPKLRKAQLILEPLRHEYVDRPADDKELDEPWSLGTLDKHPLTSEAIPAVLRSWKYCLALGLPFSIRMARWVARLHTVFEESKSTGALCHIASHYALREQLHMAEDPEGELYTSDIDAALAMEPWEFATVYKTINHYLAKGWESFWLLPMEDYPTSLSLDQQSLNSAVARAEADLQHRWLMAHCNESEELLELNYGEAIRLIPPIRDDLMSAYKKWSGQTKMVYAYWVRYLTGGPRLGSLSPADLGALINELRSWLNEHPWKGGPPRVETVQLVRDPLSQPTTLLERVGYGDDLQPKRSMKGGTP